MVLKLQCYFESIGAAFYKPISLLHTPDVVMSVLLVESIPGFVTIMFLLFCLMSDFSHKLWD